MVEVALRALDNADMDTLFDHMRDPEAVRMAAFTAADPDDRAAFDAHQAAIRARPDAIVRAVTADGQFAGTIGSFVMDGETEITYWLGRPFWGRGIAGRALALYLESMPDRPLFGRVASDNVASFKVLRRAGFAVIGTDTGYANARGAEIEETILRLD